MRRRKKEVSNSELIIFTQSLFLVSVGVAGFIASSSVIAGMKALTNKDSMVAFITDDALATDVGTISTDSALAIANNFEFICVISLTIGIVIGGANLFRILLRKKL
jgi:hypothetical protein